MSLSNILVPNNYDIECNSITLPIRTNFVPTVSALTNLTGPPIVTGSLVQQIGDIVFYCTVVSGLTQGAAGNSSFEIDMPIPQDIINGIVDGGSTATDTISGSRVSTFQTIKTGTNNIITVQWLSSLAGGNGANIRATLFFIYFESG